jgi:hypothetical protein
MGMEKSVHNNMNKSFMDERDGGGGGWKEGWWGEVK